MKLYEGRARDSYHYLYPRRPKKKIAKREPKDESGGLQKRSGIRSLSTTWSALPVVLLQPARVFNNADEKRTSFLLASYFRSDVRDTRGCGSGKADESKFRARHRQDRAQSGSFSFCLRDVRVDSLQAALSCAGSGCRGECMSTVKFTCTVKRQL